MKQHECLSPLCQETADIVGVRGNLEVFRCPDGHEFACNPRYCLTHTDTEEMEYMKKRHQATQEGWCMRLRDGFVTCDCVLCKQLH